MGLREIIWATNPHNDILEAIVREMHVYSTQIEANSSFRFSYVEKIKDPKLIIDSFKRKHILMIFKEGINNACKHSGSTIIEIGISQNKRRIKIQISDKGKGFDSEVQSTGNGLNNMKNRAFEIGGEITFDSVLNKGTSVVLRMPLP